MPPTVGRFTTARGSVIHFEEEGQGRPVLAVHGLGGGAYFFRGLGARLGGHRVIAVDLPGTGLSTAAAPFTMATWIADLGDLVAAHIGEPVAIVGHSMGTIIALEAWDAWPAWIRGLVFVGGVPEVRPVIRERLTARAEAIGSGSLAGWGPKVSPGVFSPATFASRPEVIGLFERVFEAHEAGSYLRSLQILIGASATRVVPSVAVPIVAMTGEDDQYAPPDAVRAFMQTARAPHHVAILPRAAHLPFFETPDRFAAVVGEFLDGLETAPPAA